MQDAVIMTDRDTSNSLNIAYNVLLDKSRCFGFVLMRDPQDIEVILRNGPHNLDGKMVRMFYFYGVDWLQVSGSQRTNERSASLHGDAIVSASSLVWESRKRLEL